MRGGRWAMVGALIAVFLPVAVADSLPKCVRTPRITLLIVERNLSLASTRPWWEPWDADTGPKEKWPSERIVENELMGKWIRDGFTFIDRESLTYRYLSEDIGSQSREMRLNPDDTDVAIIGTAIASSQGCLSAALDPDFRPNGMEMKSCKGSISVRAIDVRTGEVLAVSAQTATTMHIEEASCGRNALLKAAGLVAKELEGEILKAWSVGESSQPATAPQP